ncbi:MAG: hypothetical protein ABI318_18245, partial [Chthoniobacteraceae bacterium]
MPPTDRRSPRKSAVLWGIVAGVVAGIVALVCVIVFVCGPTGNRQPAGDDTAGKETAAPSGIETPASSGKETPASMMDALELVKTVHIPSRPVFTDYHVPLDAKQPSDIMVDFLTVKSGLVSSSRLPVGADIGGTTFKVHSFEHKEVAGPDRTTKDVS